ncbi:MAG: uracil-DNA glycosylase [Bacteroidota bacterium]|nr:uracil-DNA glycosylase [Bacteroidota bacterium]
MSEQNPSELQQVLSNIQKFFMQEVDLFGNVMYPSESGKGKKTDETAAAGYPQEPWASAAALDELNARICECQKCSLGVTRTKFVFGVGNPHAEIVLIGEAPGADEDAQGEPFVGRAGQLLNKILEAIHLKREEVFICNILKCRPPNNRDPQPEEVEQCEPYLWKQLELIKPKIILCLGRISAQTLLKTNDSLTKLREKVHDYRGIPLMVTFHPAALLRNPGWKRPTWEDVQKFRKKYDELMQK